MWFVLCLLVQNANTGVEKELTVKYKGSLSPIEGHFFILSWRAFWGQRQAK